MINFSKYRSILWDFDGVLLDSMLIREEGFKKVLSEFPENEVSKLVEFHRQNGGLSRYVKFRYFFEKIRNRQIEEREVLELADAFSAIMKEMLMDANLIIQDSMEFVRNNYQKIPMHIVSGSDGIELRMICEKLDIAKYFLSIGGSPTPKGKLIQDVLHRFEYNPQHIIMIGDSLNDYEAANQNNVNFAGYNNFVLMEKFEYIHTFKSCVVEGK